MTMNNFYSIVFRLLFELVLLKIATGSGSLEINSNYDEPPTNVTVPKLSEGNNGDGILANLKLITDTYLANKNIPVWIVYEDSSNKLERVSQVMNDIGPFFMYQDVENCAAAVYFSKRQQFDGTIDNSYIITNVPYDSKTQELKVSENNLIPPSTSFHPQKLSPLDKTNNNPKKPTGVYEPIQQTEIKKWKFIASRLPFPETIYIEILVIVNYDMAANFEHNYASIISYILVTFNSVDMLYSKINKPNIKINIAGIIIADTRESFPELIQENCYKKINNDDNNEEMDASCITNILQLVLNNYKETITLQSFDTVVFLTDFHLHIESSDDDVVTTFLPVTGYADTPNDNANYYGYQLSTADLKIAAVTNYHDGYQLYADVAHELAHLLNVFHDQGEFRDIDGNCIGNLMRTDGSLCRKCLLFDGTTIEQLIRFFSSRDGCMFRNKPKSLYDLGVVPKLFKNEDWQCQCYGYDYSYSSQMNFWNYCRSLWRLEVDCKSRLRCVSHENGKISVEVTGFLMDGTPCNGEKKVCWNEKCEKLINPKDFLFIST